MKKIRKQQSSLFLPFRILSYNIHQGITIHRRKLALSLLKKAIVSVKADVVVLQEVAGKRKGSEVAQFVTSEQLESLADSIWPYYAFGTNSVFSGGFHGNAILSKFPIMQHKNIDISVHFPAKKIKRRWISKRGILHAEIQLPNSQKPIHILGTHFGLLQYERKKQLNQLCSFLQSQIQNEFPCLLTGDFNDWKEVISEKLLKTVRFEEAFQKLYRRHARTFPSRFPILCLDRIYFRDLVLRNAVRLSGKSWGVLSDHLPLVADFLIPMNATL